MSPFASSRLAAGVSLASLLLLVLPPSTSLEAAELSAVLPASSSLRITEFMADNTGTLRDADGDASDWLELHNAGSEPVLLEGWSLTDDLTRPRQWLLPARSLPPNAYLIVFASGKDRPGSTGELHANFRLRAEGEALALFDPQTNLVDAYPPAYPPQAADVSYGRTAQAAATAFVAAGAPLRYWVPRAPGVPPHWFQPDFDAGGWLVGTNGVGYETTPADYAGLIQTDLRSALYQQASGCLLRIPFLIAQPEAFTGWTLEVQADDGFAAWLNGEEVVRWQVPEPLTWDAVATTNRADSEVIRGESFNLREFEPQLRAGTNWLAVHALNASRDSSDFLLRTLLTAFPLAPDLTTLAYFPQPTPGKANGAGVSRLGPRLSEVSHQPLTPAPNQTLLVRAAATPTLAPVHEVTLHYRFQFLPETVLAMADDGRHEDGLAQDGVYGAYLPPEATRAGQLLRYRLQATDTEGRTTRDPLFLRPLDSPEYHGLLTPPLNVRTPLPVFEWFVERPGDADTATGTRGVVAYGGEVFDNIFVRIRGGTSRGWPKKSYKFEFNSGAHFPLHPELRRVSELNLNTTYTDKAYVRARLAYEHQRDVGLPSPETFHVHVRRNGGFFSLALAVEQPDADFLRRHGWDPLGALYKGNPGATLESTGAFEKKTRRDESNQDLRSLISGIARTGTALESFLFDNLDLPAVMNFMATVVITQNIDATDKNYFLYRDTRGTGEWRLIPWDLDLTFGPNALNTDTIVYQQADPAAPACASHPFIGARPYLLHGGKYNRLFEALVSQPRTQAMLLRRVRSLHDQFLATRVFQDRLEELYGLLNDDVFTDRVRWGTQAHFPGSLPSFRAALDRIRNEYLNRRGAYLTSPNIVGIGAANPGPPPAPIDLQLTALDYNPASGRQDEEYLQFYNPHATALDLSDWTLAGAVQHRFAPGTVLPARDTLYLSPNVAAFRARPASPRGGQRLFVQGNYLGRLSAWGGSLSLTPPSGAPTLSFRYPGSPSALQQSLRITEILFHPAPVPADPTTPAPLEFIELTNISLDQSLDLAGTRFTDGIEFTFSQPTLLPPGHSLVLVHDLEAFQTHYGTHLPVAGTFAGRLDNAGERLRLEDPTGETILDFAYQDRWHPLADGLGPSLELAHPTAPPDQFDRAETWRASLLTGGSPGSADADADGLPDAWETSRQLDPRRDDAALDPDEDGADNRHEYLAGTDPQDPQSLLRILDLDLDGLDRPGSPVTLRFFAGAQRTFTLLAATSLASPHWQAVAHFTTTREGPQTFALTVDAGFGAASQYFVLVAPAQP